jgi:predicted nucleic acid-binding protein
MSDKENRIVVNTSPWIALSTCGQIPLLKKIYQEVHIPVGVKEEILAGGKRGIGVRELAASSWIKIGKIIDIEKVKLLFELDRGEAEVIILAKEKGINRVLMDEKVARLQAEVLGLDVIGTLGLLLRAKKNAMIPAIKPLIAKMLENDIWIKDEIVEGILRDAKED